MGYLNRGVRVLYDFAKVMGIVPETALVVEGWETALNVHVRVMPICSASISSEHVETLSLGSVHVSLTCTNRLTFPSSQTFATIMRNGLVDDCATIETLPGIENYKEIRIALQCHHPLTFGTFH